MKCLFKPSLVAASIAALYALPGHADDIEKITITAPHLALNSQIEATAKATDPDLASWLNSVPGANVNRNGPITGIAQYRGLFGDRIATTINGHQVIGAGPNAMDSPLSYSPRLLVESLSVYQGIAPVSAGLNTLGGAVQVKTLHAEFNGSEQWQSFGQTQAQYRSENQAGSMAAWLNTSKGNKAVLAYLDWQQGDDRSSADGEQISPSGYHKQQAGADIRIGHRHGEFGLSYHYSDSQDAGTPALPMDINFIHANRVNIDGNYQSERWNWTMQLGYLASDHAMDNFSQRMAMNSAMYRRNDADANTLDYKFTVSDDNWLFGLDGYQARHNADISNPANSLFAIANFNDVTDQQWGIFAQWQQQFDSLMLTTGLRAKRAVANSGDVSHSMAGQNMMVAMLMNRFNQAEHKVSDNNVDFALTLQYPISEQLSLSLSGGIKQRAPSYQERYLWLPLESTGGLADGNTYVGDIKLNSETAYQTDLGLQWHNDNWQLYSHWFYQKINDYIQGVASEDSAVIMVASMMSNRPPLQYANVDAHLAGFDGRASWRIDSAWQVNALLSYVRGKRDDIDDNLYRIAPLNGQLQLQYQQDDWQAKLSLQAVAQQHQVSATNLEQTSAGYGLLHLDASYFFNAALSLRAGIDNLLNREYHDHLGGYNRVINPDIAMMSRLPEQGRNLWLELNYTF